MSGKKDEFIIKGRVIDKTTGNGIENITVKAYDKDLIFDDFLGEAITNAKGEFILQFAKKEFFEWIIDKTPDIYLRLYNKEQKLIYSSKNNVLYNVGKETHLDIELDGSESNQKFFRDQGRTASIAEKISGNVDLMRVLSVEIDTLFKRHDIKLDRLTYVFEPVVFVLNKDSIQSLATTGANTEGDDMAGILADLGRKFDFEIESKPDRTPLCGPLNPEVLDILDKIRIADVKRLKADKIRTSDDLIRRILGDAGLMSDLSRSIFKILNEYGIKLAADEGCVFVPKLFNPPVYAQKISSEAVIAEFDPAIFAGPTPQPAISLKLKRSLAGIIDFPWGHTPGIIDWPRWRVGIPAPDLLVALDKLREIEAL